MYAKKEIIIIVDAFYNGIHYAPIFSGIGFQCIHIHSNYDFYKHHQWGKEFFIDNLIFNEHDTEKLIKKISKYKVKFVIPGSEPGVYLSDLISSRFDVLKNDFSTTQARRNKFLMIDTLKRKNIPCAKQFCSKNLDNLIKWYRNSKFKKVVVKPSLSASSDGVKICTCTEEVAEAFNSIFGKKNYIGFTNEEIVIQEYLEGPEYIVNSVSCHKTHFITDIWLGVGGIANTISTDEYAQKIEKKSSDYTVLKNYTECVLDALGVVNGPAHAEIRYTSQGPKLIELGARLAGLFDFSIIQKCQGYSQLSLAAETYLNPELFAKKIALYNKLKQNNLMRFIYLNSNISGFISKKPNLDKFLKIESLESVKFILKPGDYLDVTNKTIGRPGYASMISVNPENLDRDYSIFRKLETDFYKSITE